MKIPEIFAKNRSEESAEDNWVDFVVPYFINDLEIKTQTKAVVIIGGRGCGKTTLLRYFCHPTQFSPKRKSLPKDCFSHIGIYWRADTNFLNAFIGGDVDPKVWRAAFEHLLACEFSKEILRSLRSINCNSDREEEYGQLRTIDFSELKDFSSEFGTTISDVEGNIKKLRIELGKWVNNLETEEKPSFLPVIDFLSTLVGLLKRQLNYLSDTTFAVFIDEYENLRLEQQKFINGLLKHGAAPLIFNIALKRNSWQTQETIGAEAIQDISDYREIDLEREMEKDFELFAAELMFSRISDSNPNLSEFLPISKDVLRSVDKIKFRHKNSEYRENVIRSAEAILPRVSDREAAIRILSDSKLRRKLLNLIGESLKKRKINIDPNEFLSEELPEATMLMPYLINRDREDVYELLNEFKNALNNKNSRLLAGTDLVNNNLFGCVNAIYIESQRDSILFSGFSSLTKIANGNIRHLLELIHRIFKNAEIESEDELPTVPPEIQVRAVMDTSESILKSVRGLGVCGPQLFNLAMSLGSLFKIRHRDERQSEPEVNHFTIGSGGVTQELEKYLKEAEKWSVLFLSKETKMKSAGVIGHDYVLNPIFSPFFQISFRKKRSMQLSENDLLIMASGDQENRDSLIRVLTKKEGNIENVQISLFGW